MEQMKILHNYSHSKHIQSISSALFSKIFLKLYYFVLFGIISHIAIPIAFAEEGDVNFNPDGAMDELIGYAYSIVTPIITSVAILSIIIAGFQFMFSQGDSDLAGKSKERLMGSVMGLILIILIAVILHEINPSAFTLE